MKKSGKGSKWANGAAGFPAQRGANAPGKPNNTVGNTDGGQEVKK